jgi:predicted O-methyltransferase YrrM
VADRNETQAQDGNGSTRPTSDSDAHVAAESVYRLEALAPTGTWGMSVRDQKKVEGTAKGAARRPLTSPSDLEVAIALVDEQFGGLPYMTTKKALSLGALIQREGLSSLLELGTFHGKSTAYLASVLEALGRGTLVTVDRVDAEVKNPNVYQILRSLGLSHRVQVYLEPRSLTWRLMTLIEEHERPCFDFCYFDAGHSWDVTGFAFFLVDRLLKPGGWVVFDDLNWTFERMIKPGEPVPEFLSRMPEEELRTAQIDRVWNLLVVRSTGYERHEVIGSWGVARKRVSSA